MGLEPISSSLRATQDLKIRSIFWNRYLSCCKFWSEPERTMHQTRYTRAYCGRHAMANGTSVRDGSSGIQIVWLRGTRIWGQNKFSSSRWWSLSVSLSGLKAKLHRLQNQVHPGKNRRRLGFWVYNELSSTGQQWRRSDCSFS